MKASSKELLDRAVAATVDHPHHHRAHLHGGNQFDTHRLGSLYHIHW